MGKRHKAKLTPKGIYYACNTALGKLSEEQIEKRTNIKHGTKITCKNCLKHHKYKRWDKK